MIHKSADVSPKAKIGKNVQVWHFSQIREKALIGDNCIIGKNVYIDHDVKIGSNVKIQNNALVYFGTTIKNDVFIGPAVILTNDKYPRSTTSTGKLKVLKHWQAGKILVKHGASIGAGSIILPSITIGNYALIGAGSTVTKSVPDHALLLGNPARIVGYVCKNGHQLEIKSKKHQVKYQCNTCGDKGLLLL